MFKSQGKYNFSPSDLTLYVASPFASWMNRYVLDNPENVPDKDPEDEFMGVLQNKGYEHEDLLEAQFVEQGLTVLKVEGRDYKEQHDKTISAMRDGVAVIVQARLELDLFGGFADFLVRVEGKSNLGDYHYEVWDTKLSRSVKTPHVIQLCCYAEMLQAAQGRLPTFVTVSLGSGENEVFRTHDCLNYYKSLKTSFLEEQAAFNSKEMPDPAESSSWGDWSSYAAHILESRDHLSMVANIKRSQIIKLNNAGIMTAQELIDAPEKSIPKLNTLIFNRLKDQAAIQKQSIGLEKPKFKILLPDKGEKKGLALLPAHSPMDVFFDIEGYPLVDGGLEYLWGNTFFNESGERDFIDFWAHDPEQEKQCFINFIAWVFARWKKDPSMHIYHYASYEITACRKLMGRYGVCEYEVDQLLRNEVFVDLYKVVGSGLLIGEPRYSIKNVEHLYRGKRETAVGDGGASIVVYENWRNRFQSGEEGDTWQESPMLMSIRDYNIDDCDSTQELVDWLRDQQQKHAIDFIGKTGVEEPEIPEDITARTVLRDTLLRQADALKTTNIPQAELTENLAWMLEFHRREAKPMYWRLFDRLGSTESELFDDLDCLAMCTRTERAPFKLTERTRNLSYEYQFDVAQEFKDTNSSFYLLGIDDENEKSVGVKYIKEHSNLELGLVVLQSKHEPPSMVTLVPNEHVRPDPIPAAITDVVKRFESNTLGRCAIIDFLERAKPNISAEAIAGGAIAPSTNSEERLKQVITAISNLNNSYLPIQGPPGTGKSYTAKHVIAQLLKKGAKIGISSNSHKAINNLLLSAAVHCKEQGIPAEFVCTSDTEPELATTGVLILKNNDLANHTASACVIGTTAWGFSRDDMAGKLDYLFIDEAGQVSVANLIAMSRSATNLILIGDQMQLGQPSQGTHPAESGLSILDYLLHDTPTIADDMGVFLGTTYRMHPEVNRFISEHIYEAKLSAHPETEQRVLAVPQDYVGPLDKDAGIIYIPVEHEGNTQASEEEVLAIVKHAKDLLGRDFFDGTVHRPIEWADMLFVAPYNHQVSKLKQALGEQAKVGSVDKFQGQEAPIVFLSMCASDANESPRGIDFLFNRNRINVAISRAQTLAIVVSNPSLTNTRVNSVEQMKLVNLFSSIVQYV